MQFLRIPFFLDTVHARLAGGVLAMAALFAGCHALARPAPLVISCALPTAAGPQRDQAPSESGSSRPMLPDEGLSTVKEKLD